MYKRQRKERYCQYDELLEWILHTLEKNDIKATFFCVGQLAVEFPEVVRKIADKGHEIGSHSNRHLWVNKMIRREFEEDTYIAIQEIENLIGQKVKSFRAVSYTHLWEGSILLLLVMQCMVHQRGLYKYL